MESTLKRRLQECAAQYNTTEFIKGDPCQFPHRFKRKQDIEISGFLASWISYGRREQIISKCEIAHRLIGHEPYEFIQNAPASFIEIKQLAEQGGTRNTFYRFYTYEDLYQLLCRLYKIYDKYESMEDAVIAADESNIVRKVSLLFEGIKGIPSNNGNSAHKRIAMFLRWMVRQDHIVGFSEGLGGSVGDQCLERLREVGINERKDASWKTAREITEALSEVFPDDPCLGDFALFGMGINDSYRIK